MFYVICECDICAMCYAWYGCAKLRNVSLLANAFSKTKDFFNLGLVYFLLKCRVILSKNTKNNQINNLHHFALAGKCSSADSVGRPVQVSTNTIPGARAYIGNNNRLSAGGRFSMDGGVLQWVSAGCACDTSEVGTHTRIAKSACTREWQPLQLSITPWHV